MTRRPRPLRLWIAAARPRFITITLAAVALGLASAAADGTVLSWTSAAGTALGAVLMHAGANLINDFHDRDADAVNGERLSPYTGGSRMIQDGTFAASTIAVFGYLLLAASVGVGLMLALPQRMQLFAVGGIGILLGILYSAPPVRLCGRGFGEASVAGAWLLVVVGADVVQRGAWSVTPWALGMPLAALVCAILLVNEFPDHGADRTARKNTLVVLLGPQSARWVYVAVVAVGYAWLAVMAAIGVIPAGGWFGLLGLPFSLDASRIVLAQAGRQPSDRMLPAIRSTLVAAHIHAVALVLGMIVWP